MTTATKDILRRYRFAPYLKGHGPTFTLTTWYTGKTDNYGKCAIGYSFKQDGIELFAGEDFHCSPRHAIDSDEVADGLMGFLTLRKGDTDAEYFADYTPAQIEFSEQHAESLSCYLDSRWHDENGNFKAK